MSTQGHEGICVGIRIRPLNEKEKRDGQEKIFVSTENTVSQVFNGQAVDNQTYSYDKVFSETCSTREIYSNIALQIVKGVMDGINGTIFACK